MSGVAQLALASELNQLASSRIIADCSLRLLFANTPAEAHLKAGTVLAITTDHRLAFQRPDHKRQFQRAFGLRDDMPHGRASHGNRSTNTPVVLTSELTQIVIRKVDTEHGAHYYSISVFDERSIKQPDADILKASFGLTNAETRLALLLAAGATTADATEALCISRHTVRAHLRALFEKVGVSRQADLVRKIICGPAMS